MEAVVAAMRSGWRRPGRNGGLDGDLVSNVAARSYLVTSDGQCSMCSGCRRQRRPRRRPGAQLCRASVHSQSTCSAVCQQSLLSIG